MKRDIELIRLLLLERESGETLPAIANYSAEDRHYNIQLMDDANLVVANFVTGNQGEVVDSNIDRLT